MTIHPDVHSLAGAYAVDALDDDERRAFEAHLPDCEVCRDEVAGFQATAAMLGGAAAEAPPEHLRASVLEEVGRTRQDPPVAVQARPSTEPGRVRLTRGPARRAWFERMLLPAAAVMAVVVAGLAIMVGNLNQRIDTIVGAEEVAAVVAAEDLQTWEAALPEGGSARVVYSPSRGEGWFLADGMSAVPSGKVYEMWLIDDDGPAPSGLFHAEDGVVAHAFTGDLAGVEALAVTVEPASGSLTPTTDPVVVLEL